MESQCFGWKETRIALQIELLKPLQRWLSKQIKKHESKHQQIRIIISVQEILLLAIFQSGFEELLWNLYLTARALLLEWSPSPNKYWKFSNYFRYCLAIWLVWWWVMFWQVILFLLWCSISVCLWVGACIPYWCYKRISIKIYKDVHLQLRQTKKIMTRKRLVRNDFYNHIW